MAQLVQTRQGQIGNISKTLKSRLKQLGGNGHNKLLFFGEIPEQSGNPDISFHGYVLHGSLVDSLESKYPLGSLQNNGSAILPADCAFLRISGFGIHSLAPPFIPYRQLIISIH
ncbi:hypothetical protein D3C81_1481670 [compost metagenome]